MEIVGKIIQSLTQLREAQIKKGMFICSIITIISTFLPFYKISIMGESDSMKLLDRPFGMILIIVAVLIFVLSYLNKSLFLSICSIVPFIIYCIVTVQMKSLLTSNGYLVEAIGRSMIHKGSGFYLLLFASIVLLGLGIIYLFVDERNRMLINQIRARR